MNEDDKKSLKDVGVSWQAVYRSGEDADAPARQERKEEQPEPKGGIDFVGKNLEGGKFVKENLIGANFSVANLKNVDFSGSDLRGADFSGADLTGANFADADLGGVNFSGAQLEGANFKSAKLNGVRLVDANIKDADLTQIEIDAAGQGELQALIEYLAKYYPHKLNLSKINLRGLDLSKIDLKNINLRGVDFTGCSFFGVNIFELDLSECVISREQIAQALGRDPTQDELRKILAPKPKAKQGKGAGIDFTDLFLGDGREFGVIDTTKDKGIDIGNILKAGKKIFRHSAEKPEMKEEGKGLEKEERSSENDKEELRKVLEERKRQEHEARMSKKQEIEKTAVQKEEKKKNIEGLERIAQIKNRSRDM